MVKSRRLDDLQMNGAMAKQSYPKYLKATANNCSGGCSGRSGCMSARVALTANSARRVADARQWQEMQGSLVESLQGGAKFLTFEMGDKNFIKLLA